jgi:hypothetical protein
MLECGSACCGSSTEGEINVLDGVQKKAAQFTNRTKDSDWETLAQRKTIARLCALCTVYCVLRTAYCVLCTVYCVLWGAGLGR